MSSSVKYPPVAVIVPVYGRGLIIRDAIESIFLQDYQGDIEVIVVDDASDNCIRSCLASYMSRIKYFRLDKNSGVSAARNAGISCSTAEYIGFLDSDDIFLPSKITLQIENLSASGLSISHTNEFWYKKDRFINQGKKHQRYGGKIFAKVLDMCRVSPSSLLVHKDVFKDIGLFDEGLRVCEDYEWTLRCALKYDFCYMEEKLLIKRAITDNSLSASIQNIESIRLNILKSFENKYGASLSDGELLALRAELARKNTIVKVEGGGKI